FLGVLLHQLTGSSVYDAVGSILVGILLGIVALVLIDRNGRFLVGQETDPAIQRLAIDLLLESDRIERVSYLHLEYVGANRVFLVAAVDLPGDDTETHVAVELRRLEREIERDEHVERAVLTLAVPGEPSL
ncbi:MAG: cation transporter, partial [Microbacteriaceae bacterium]|nr:cation transporter [Microbacteriaceae bacterium]